MNPLSEIEILEGKYLASTVETKFNTVTNEVINNVYQNIIIIKKIAEKQYLAEFFWFNDPVPYITLLFVNDSEGWFSNSYDNGVNRIFFENGKLIQTFSDVIKNGVLINGVITMCKLLC
jgi:hypothetical protein